MAKKDKKYKRIKSEEAGAAEAEAPPLDASEHIKRLNRVAGQIEGIQKMLAKARDLDAVLIQCKAVHAALRAVERQLLQHYLDAAVDEIVGVHSRKSREEKISQLMELYRPV